MKRGLLVVWISGLATAAGCQGSSDPGPVSIIDAADPGAVPDGAATEGDASGANGCTGLLPQPLDNEWTLEVDGRERTFFVHVPESYDPAVRTPLVLNFHGFSSNASQQQLLTLMPEKSDAEGFVVVHPEGVGLPQGWNAGVCCGQAMTDGVDDVAFVEAMIEQLEAALCIDADRIYATGFSNGGFLSHRLACELSGRIAAIAPVSGVIGIDTCEPGRPVPVLQFHGTADAVVAYDGNSVLGFPSVEGTMSDWAMRNGCDATAELSYENGDTTCVRYGGCDNGADVELCTVDLGGHTWPGGTPFPPGGHTTTDISATDAMWEFFSGHPMP